MNINFIKTFINKKSQIIKFKSVGWEDLYNFINFLEKHVSHSEDFFQINKIFLEKNEVENMTQLMKLIEDRTCILICALHKDSIVGFSTILRDPKDKNTGYFEIFIHRNHRNSGIGSEFIKSILKYSKYMKIKNIKLSVRANNYNAIKLYKKFGFVKTHRENNNILYKKNIYSEIFMSRVL